jgi:endonuclease/exonuclease/phosphatase family metal-dependent hydrolase
MAVVLTWNVAGRVRSVAAQANAVATCPADIVALQEVRATARAAWEEHLAALGYLHVLATLPPGGAQRPAERRLGVLIAGRAPLQACPMPELPWPERYLVARTLLDGAVVELHNLHAPISSKADEVKVRTLEAVHAELAAAPRDVPRILVGDLNTPQYESREGEVQSFARTRSGRIRPTHGERHDRAELSLIVGLREHGYADAFRALHGYERRDRSWLYPHRKTGYRLDHILVRGLDVAGCEYEHGWRDEGLSDHAAMWAQLTSLSPTGPAAGASRG